MKKFAQFIVAGLIAAGTAVGVSAPAQAGVSFEIGVGGPAYYGYDYYRPCRWYFEHDFPAPNRCYRDYVGFYGPHVYISDGFVFRDRGHWDRWRVRDDYRHWRTHDWRVHERRVDRRLDRRMDRLERRDRHERREDRREHHHHH